MGGLKDKFKKNRQWKDWSIILGIFVATILIFALTKYHEDRSFFVLSSDAFLGLHIILEFSAIVMAFCVFAVTYYTSEQTRSASMLIIACTFLSVTFLDTV